MRSDTFSFTDRCWQEKAAALLKWPQTCGPNDKPWYTIPSNPPWLGVIPHIPHVYMLCPLINIIGMMSKFCLWRHGWTFPLPLAVVSVRPGPANWFWSWFWSMVLAGIDHVLGWIFMVCGCMCLDCMMVQSCISSGTVIFKWSLPIIYIQLHPITIYIYINGPFPWQTVWLPCRRYIPNNIDHWGLTSTMTLWRYGDTNRIYIYISMTMKQAGLVEVGIFQNKIPHDHDPHEYCIESPRISHETPMFLVSPLFNLETILII